MGDEDSIRALATVTLDVRSLDPEAIERLAALVEARLVERGAVGEERLLSAAAAAELVGVSAATVRRAIRTGALVVVGMWVRGRGSGALRFRRGWLVGSGRRRL